MVFHVDAFHWLFVPGLYAVVYLIVWFGMDPSVFNPFAFGLPWGDSKARKIAHALAFLSFLFVVCSPLIKRLLGRGRQKAES